MTMRTSATSTSPSTNRLPAYGAACVASGVLGVVAGAVTLLYDPGVPSDQWSYPFSTSVQWVVSSGLALTHVLSALGFVGVLLARPHGDSRAASVTLRIAIVGFWLLALAELLSGAVGGEDVDSSAAAWVGTLFGVSSLMTALGGVVAGTVIVRAGRWHGPGAWMVLASGVVMIVLVTPANVAGDLVPRTLALVLWSLTFIPLGRAVARSAT
jgi:hypothetical protein